MITIIVLGLLAAVCVVSSGYFLGRFVNAVAELSDRVKHLEEMERSRREATALHVHNAMAEAMKRRDTGN